MSSVIRYKTLHEMLQPFLNTPVRITYKNGRTALIFDKIIRFVKCYKPDDILIGFDDGVIFFEQKIMVKQMGEFLTIETIEPNGSYLSLVRWSDLPKEFQPYSNEIAEMVGRACVSKMPIPTEVK
ncbi:hypothetical protein IW967_11615 [Alicyclobacillus mali]|uniref:Transcriptional regulator n=1 Tax=Alicyclobacillus mali (ex Roth et al. 2021) TaxID=1123961 RepID=A0ABS0F5F4_9BACL|nr:hypothetical protein [Alicyclobacillus mali (ex Roth et al. 2021)]MBF8378502.1 hypothetical protein [Alicyclobacillus mali (ex Roth et al. 2021)]